MREWLDVLALAGNLHNLLGMKLQGRLPGAARPLLPTLGRLVSSNDGSLQAAALRCLLVRTRFGVPGGAAHDNLWV